MAKKTWKYEADCARVRKLIEETATVSGDYSTWVRDATLVLNAIGKVRSKATPLALHFISTSAKELLDGRFDTAKLCLLSAQSLVTSGLLDHLMYCYDKTFPEGEVCQKCGGIHPPQIPPVLQALLNGSPMDLAGLPEGVHEIMLAPGMTAKVIKKFFPATADHATPQAKAKNPVPGKKGKAKTLPPPNRFN